MTEHLGGIFGLALGMSLTILWMFRYQKIAVILLAAFLLRAGATLFHTFVMRLPDGISDAVGFENSAYMWSLRGFGEALAAFGDRGMSYMYSNVGALVYVMFGRDALLLQSFSVIAGVFAVILTYKLTRLVWDDEHIARKAAWAMTLFPVMVMYSALTMREPFIVVLFLAALIYVVKWTRSESYVDASVAIGLFLMQVFLHAGMALGGIVFAGIVVFATIRTAVRRLGAGYVRMVPWMVTIVVVIGLSLTWYQLVGLRIPYIGSVTGLLDPGTVTRIAEAQIGYAAGSAWPSWLLPSSTGGILLITPFRMLYFMFSPFPWDIRTPMHLIGMLDGVLYIVLAWWIYQNRALYRENRAAKVILILLLPLILAFAWGTANFGTGLRHRVKLVGALIALAGPRLPNIVLRRRKALAGTIQPPLPATQDP